MKIKHKIIYFLKLIRYFIYLNGIFFLLCLILAFTTLPYWGYHWLGTSKSAIKQEPAAIFQLGGGGMPSESNLMRSWYTLEAATGFPDAEIFIVMPGDIKDKNSTPVKMKKELLLRGACNEKIRFENTGTNTRSQALNCSKLLDIKKPILLVTSPEHMRRAVMCFEKAGFESVSALPAFANAAEADFTFIDDELGGNTAIVPDIGDKTSVRYQVWNHFKYEILIIREWIALGYYWIRGWI